jgi:hypothetical protein
MGGTFHHARRHFVWAAAVRCRCPRPLADPQSQFSSAQLHQTPSTRTTQASSSTFCSLALFLRVETCKQPYQQWGELLNFVAVRQTQFGQYLIRSIGEIDQDLAPVRRIVPPFDQTILDEPVD